MLKKSVVLLVLLILLSSYFIAAEEVVGDNGINNNPQPETPSHPPSETAIETAMSSGNSGGSECGFFCKIGKFLWGDASNRAGQSWFDRGNVVGMAYSSCKGFTTSGSMCQQDGKILLYDGSVYKPVVGYGKDGPQTAPDVSFNQNELSQVNTQGQALPEKEVRKVIIKYIRDSASQSGPFSPISGIDNTESYRKVGQNVLYKQKGNNLYVYSDSGEWRSVDNDEKQKVSEFIVARQGEWILYQGNQLYLTKDNILIKRSPRSGVISQFYTAGAEGNSLKELPSGVSSPPIDLVDISPVSPVPAGTPPSPVTLAQDSQLFKDKKAEVAVDGSWLTIETPASGTKPWAKYAYDGKNFKILKKGKWEDIDPKNLQAECSEICKKYQPEIIALYDSKVKPLIDAEAAKAKAAVGAAGPAVPATPAAPGATVAPAAAGASPAVAPAEQKVQSDTGWGATFGTTPATSELQKAEAYQKELKKLDDARNYLKLKKENLEKSRKSADGLKEDISKEVTKISDEYSKLKQEYDTKAQTVSNVKTVLDNSQRQLNQINGELERIKGQQREITSNLEKCANRDSTCRAPLLEGGRILDQQASTLSGRVESATQERDNNQRYYKQLNEELDPKRAELDQKKSELDVTKKRQQTVTSEQDRIFQTLADDVALLESDEKTKAESLVSRGYISSPSVDFCKASSTCVIRENEVVDGVKQHVMYFQSGNNIHQVLIKEGVPDDSSLRNLKVTTQPGDKMLGGGDQPNGVSVFRVVDAQGVERAIIGKGATITKDGTKQVIQVGQTIKKGSEEVTIKDIVREGTEIKEIVVVSPDGKITPITDKKIIEGLIVSPEAPSQQLRLPDEVIKSLTDRGGSIDRPDINGRTIYAQRKIGEGKTETQEIKMLTGEVTSSFVDTKTVTEMKDGKEVKTTETQRELKANNGVVIVSQTSDDAKKGIAKIPGRPDETLLVDGDVVKGLEGGESAKFYKDEEGRKSGIEIVRIEKTDTITTTIDLDKRRMTVQDDKNSETSQYDDTGKVSFDGKYCQEKAGCLRADGGTILDRQGNPKYLANPDYGENPLVPTVINLHGRDGFYQGARYGCDAERRCTREYTQDEEGNVYYGEPGTSLDKKVKLEKKGENYKCPSESSCPPEIAKEAEEMHMSPAALQAQRTADSIYTLASAIKSYPAISQLLGWDKTMDNLFGPQYSWLTNSEKLFAPMLGSNWFPSAVCENSQDIEPKGYAMIKTTSGTYQAVASIQMERSSNKVPLLCHKAPQPEAKKEWLCDEKQVCVENNFCYKDTDENEEPDDEKPLEGKMYKVTWAVSSPRDEAFTPFRDENGVSVSFNVFITDALTGKELALYSRNGDEEEPISLKNGESDRQVKIFYSDKNYNQACIKWKKPPVTVPMGSGTSALVGFGGLAGMALGGGIGTAVGGSVIGSMSALGGGALAAGGSKWLGGSYVKVENVCNDLAESVIGQVGQAAEEEIVEEEKEEERGSGEKSYKVSTGDVQENTIPS